MAGRFEGLSDLEWKLFEDIFPPEPEKRGKGMPHAPYRYVLNSLLYILITGCRWCDLHFRRYMGIKERLSQMVEAMVLRRNI
jgi:transposase